MARFPVDRDSPALAALFDGLGRERNRAILDLGAGDGRALDVYGRYARWVRFADVLGTALTPGAGSTALLDLPPHPERPYDLVLAWDLLDRLAPDQRRRWVTHLAEITAPDVRILAVIDSPDEASLELLRYTVLAPGRMRCEGSNEMRPPHPRIAPAEVQNILEPFRILRAYTTRLGMREYLAVHGGEGGDANPGGRLRLAGEQDRPDCRTGSRGQATRCA